MKSLEISNGHGHDEHDDDEGEERATLLDDDGANGDEWKGAFQRMTENKMNKKVITSRPSQLWTYVVVGIFITIVAMSMKLKHNASIKDDMVIPKHLNTTDGPLILFDPELKRGHEDEIYNIEEDLKKDDPINNTVVVDTQTAPETTDNTTDIVIEKETSNDVNSSIVETISTETTTNTTVDSTIQTDSVDDNTASNETVVSDNNTSATETNVTSEQNNNTVPETTISKDVATVGETNTTGDITSSTSSSVTRSIEKEGFHKHPAKLSDTYLPRGMPMTDEQKKVMTDKWGSWTLKAPTITENIPIDEYPNGDVPSEAFPSTAWQTNPEYLKDWLPQSIALVERAMEAILAEYGNGIDDRPNISFEERSFMFSLSLFNTSAEKAYNNKNPPGNGGYATYATLNAIKRRLLRSIMLEDTFIIVMGGHSAAAGHGNHFQQSYTLQAQRILEPILARLGVYHQAHNFGFGGLGTGQNGLAAGDMYGKNIDILIWDSGMTEGDMQSKDLFVRQSVLSGNRVPVIWNEPYSRYQESVPEMGWIATGFGGAGLYNMPRTEDEIQVKRLPWATRYLNCSREANDLCSQSRYLGQCWVDRDDFTPPHEQKAVPGGQASWHPGNRFHQLGGRIIAFTVLQQLLTGLKEWLNTEDYALPDEFWHIADEHDRMRKAVLNLTDNHCETGSYPKLACNVPINGRSEFTPRFNPAETSIRGIIMDGVKIPDPQPNCYDPPDVRLPALDPPEGEIDVVRIIENGIEFSPNKARRAMVEGALAAHKTRRLAISKSDLPPGQGWDLDSKSAPDNCDGTYDSFCGKDKGADCLLIGHNDNRGNLLFDSYSGWLKLSLENVTHGLIFVGIYDWMGPQRNWATANFECENNYNCIKENRTLHKKKKNRQLGGNTNRCYDYTLEFAIDGNVTSWNKDQYEANRRQPERVVHIFTFLDDPTYTANKEDKTVELAIRLLGCGRESTFGLTHVYWA